jgi:hypothetical protein
VNLSSINVVLLFCLVKMLRLFPILDHRFQIRKKHRERNIEAGHIGIRKTNLSISLAPFAARELAMLFPPCPLTTVTTAYCDAIVTMLIGEPADLSAIHTAAYTIGGWELRLRKQHRSSLDRADPARACQPRTFL